MVVDTLSVDLADGKFIQADLVGNFNGDFDVNRKVNQPKNISVEDLFYWLEKKSPKPSLIDVREFNELEIASFSKEVIHLPLSQSSQWIDNLPRIIPPDHSGTLFFTGSSSDRSPVLPLGLGLEEVPCV